VQAAVVWYGIFDFMSFTATETRVSPAVTSNYLGCMPRDCPEVAALASPVTHLDRSDPPMLLVHGTVDKEVPMNQSEQMAARMKQLGVPVQTAYVPDVDHGFIGATPQLTRSGSLLALQKTFDYIEATVRPVGASKAGPAAAR
jgi:dipeptidyl aminopeptidase/acylaminoacyl peptidase